MKLITQIMDARNQPVNYELQITRERLTYTAIILVDKLCIGGATFSQEKTDEHTYDAQEKDCLYISIIHNYSKEPNRYKYVGTALVECIFKQSHVLGLVGRIELISEWDSPLFWHKMGFTHTQYDLQTKPFADQYCATALAQNRQLTADEIANSTGMMYLPPTSIKTLREKYGLLETPAPSAQGFFSRRLFGNSERNNANVQEPETHSARQPG